jgi:HD-GYP domain-containing protein (c-di-GMP phosphodiesterase class II)
MAAGQSLYPGMGTRDADGSQEESGFYRRLVETGLTLLSKENNLDHILRETVALAMDIGEADAATLYVIQGNELEFRVARNLTLERQLTTVPLERFTLPLDNNTVCGHVGKSGETLFIDDVQKLDPSLPFRFGTSVGQRIGYQTRSMLVMPLTNSTGAIAGVLQLINHLSPGGFSAFPKSLQNPLAILARQSGMALSNAILTDALKRSQFETVYRLGLAAESRDKETGKHLQRVSQFGRILARWAGCSPEFQDQICAAAPMHDVGKIGLPDAILLKPGTLTDGERGIMKSHTTLGYQILQGSQSFLLECGAVIALTHHEKWDGSGYPKGLRGEEIPIEGRIIALADVFDALISKRCYKEAWTLEKTQELICVEKGKQFDPSIVDAFIKGWEEIRHTADTLRD